MIETWCGGCLTAFTLPFEDAVLLVPDDKRYQTALTFLCPFCDSRRVLHCSERKARQLLKAGVVCQQIQVAVPSWHRPGPVLDENDLIDLMLMLERGEAIV